jgi:hypothetical protein
MVVARNPLTHPACFTELEMPRSELSGRFWVEGEAGLAEESVDENGPSLDAVQLVPHRGGELVCGAGREVSQAVLHHRPGAFDRVEVGGVGRQLDHRQPVRVAGGEGAHLPAQVRAEVVPDHDDRGLQVGSGARR